MTTRFHTVLFEDVPRLGDYLAGRGLVPYQDFEVLTTSLSCGTIEIDPFGQPERLLPHLDAFADANGYIVLPHGEFAGALELLLDV